MEEAQFYKKLKDETVQCQLCHHYCLINNGNRGICGVRQNQSGILYSLVYGKVAAENIDPIEKKPLFHFLPGSLCYSIATVGCNFRCAHCQNADLSQAAEHKFDSTHIPGTETIPEAIVKRAIKNNCQSIAYTYSEPTIFAEYALDCMKLAHQKGLKNVWVSNGYTAPEAWPKIIPYLDAINVDLKFFKNQTYQDICGAKLQPVIDNLKFLITRKIWVEITTLIIPGLNDSDIEINLIANFIKNDLGADVPWHISAFYPAYKMKDVMPTEAELIYNAYEIGRQAGLEYVYGGNIMDDRYSNTYCPNCHEIVIQRNGYKIKRLDNNKKCSRCGESIKIIE